MGESARIRSVEALRDAKAALAEFSEQVGAAISSVDADISRMTQWLQQDRPAHYKHAVRRVEEEITRAKSDISRKQMMAVPEVKSVVDEKKALDRLKRRLEDLQKKQESVRRWGPMWEREALMYKSATRGLSESVGARIPAAIKRLDRMAISLEDYWRLKPASGEEAVGLSPSDRAMMDAALGTELSSGWGVDDGAAPVQALGTRDKYGPLRASGPTREAIEAMYPGPFATGWSAGTVRESDTVELGKLSSADALPAGDHLLTLGWRATHTAGVYLLRGEPFTRPDGKVDSGWYIGPLERPEEPGGYGSVRVDLFLSRLPGLSAVLALRPGTLTVLSAGNILSVLDGTDRELWKGLE